MDYRESAKRDLDTMRKIKELVETLSPEYIGLRSVVMRSLGAAESWAETTGGNKHA